MKKVISRKQLPTKFPFWEALISWLALDHFNAHGWSYGVVGCIFVLAGIGSIYSFVTEKEIKINI